MRSSRLLHAAIAAAVLACGEPSTPAETDAGTDSGPPPSCDPLPPFETGDPTGHPDPLGAGPGESRAGVLEESMLPFDRTGLAVWEAGDFVLANDRVALLIENAGDSDLYDLYGGRPVGVARVKDGVLEEAGDFNEILFGFGAYLVATESVTVLADGSDGGPAIVRAVGTLGPVDFAGDLLSRLVPGNFEGLPAVMDYKMAPGSDAVEISMTVGAPEPRGVRTSMMISAFFQHYRMPFWLEDGGFVTPNGAIPGVWFIDDEATSYAWLAPEDDSITTLVEVSGVMAFSSGGASVPGCGTSRVRLGTMVLGGPGLPGLQQAVARHRGETLRTVTGTVTESDGSPATGVRVHARRADGRHFARVTPAANGTFSLDVPNEPITFTAFREGTSLAAPVEVAVGESEASLTMPAHATIAVNVRDAADRTGPTIPARVQVIPADGAPVIPGDLGERVHNRGRAHVAFTTSGMVELPVDPGEHRIVVSRGYEFELHTETVIVAAGERAEVNAILERSVDTTGVMCADYHVHTHRSPDSPDSAELKLMGLIADGLEIAVRSDHEWVNDFQPLIEAMGLDAYAFGISGQELTTFAWGHFGVFPLTADPSRRNAGAVPWIGRLPPAVFNEARSRPEAPAFIINHPRSGGTFGGYFNAAGFSRTTGLARADYWDEEFTLVEVFNDGNVEEHADVVADWFALLNSGRRVFAVGSSDSHGIFGSPVGYPRTCLELGTDDPRDLTPNMVRDVTAAGRSTVSGGLYLTVTGPGGAGPGEEITGVGDTVMFDVTVQAASWIDGVDRLEVIVDGTVVETIPITEDDRDPDNAAVRLRAVGMEGISVPVASTGSWVVFHAAATGDLAPVHPDRAAFAVSNPIFLSR